MTRSLAELSSVMSALVFDPPPSHEAQLMLADLPADDRKRVWKNALKATPRRWWYAIFACLSIGLAEILFPRRSVGQLLAVAIAAYFGGTVDEWVRARSAIPHVRRELGLIGRCAGCGYDLRETIGTCPECGAPI